MATYRDAESLLAAVTGSALAAALVRAALAACWSYLCYVLYSTGRAADGLLVLRQTRSDQEVLAGAAGNTRNDLAGTIRRIGILLSRTGKPADAEAEQRKAMSFIPKFDDDNRKVPIYGSGLATALYNFGEVVRPLGRASVASDGFDVLECKPGLPSRNPG